MRSWLFQTTMALLSYSTNLTAEVSPLLCWPAAFRVALLLDAVVDETVVDGKLHPWQRHSSAEISDSSLTPGQVKLMLWPALTTTV